jgi:hypothetical protein
MRLERAPSFVELPDDAVVKAEDVARYLGVSRDTVRRSKIPFVAVSPKRPRYLVRDVRRWVEQQRQGAA